MKKSILFLFACIPLFASCNQNSRGFPNPFPEDTYHPTGFNFEVDERVSRPLTTTEQTLVNTSFEKQKDCDQLIKHHRVTIETRDYTRAFAGVFEQGYNIPNISETTTSDAYKQDADPSVTPKPLKRRTVTKSNSKTIYDYSYGRNTSAVETTEWHYFAAKDESVENEIIVTETAGENDAEYIIAQKESSESSTNTGVILAKKSLPTNDGEEWDNEPDEVFTEGLRHSEFLMKLSDCSSTPGADKENNIILVKEEHTPYGEDKSGVYTLPDGRAYQAMVNSITISRLTKQTSRENEAPAEWYLVSYARRYTETTITSEEIQPNVPISMLSNPIVIRYSEEKHYFYTESSETFADDIPEVTIEMEDK